MKTDEDRPPFSQLDDDVNDDEVDPNSYGEEVVNFGGDEQHGINTDTFVERACSSPVPPIKSELEGIIIRREQSPIRGLDDHSIPMMVVEAVSEAKPSDTLLSHEDCSRPPKRRRLIPEVLLYTWKDLQKQRKNDFEKIKNMSNPIVQKPKNIELSLSSLYDRLKLAGLDPFKVTLEPEIRDQGVSRAFMSSVYELTGHVSQNQPGKNSGARRRAFHWPGNPGLFFRSKVNWAEVEADIVGRVYKMLVRVDGGIWLYLGDCVLFDVPPLSKEEWKDMTAKARNSWVNLMMKKGWATHLRAKVIARRELGRKPTEDEWSRVSAEGRANNVTPEDIYRALDNGDEQLGITGMKCVGYDEAFQRQVVERFSRWVPPVPKSRNPRRGRRGENDPKLESDSECKPDVKQELQKPKTKPKTPQRSRKRKREATPESVTELSEDLDPDTERFLHDIGSKNKLRRTSVVNKQEDDLLRHFGLFDYV